MSEWLKAVFTPYGKIGFGVPSSNVSSGKKIRFLSLGNEGRGDIFEIKKKEKRLIIPSNLRTDRNTENDSDKKFLK